jgi:hypothetical protein
LCCCCCRAVACPVHVEVEGYRRTHAMS